MIQNQLNQLPEQKRYLEFNPLDLRNFLEEIQSPALLANIGTGQIISVNSQLNELVDLGFFEITGADIYQLIPEIDFKNCSDGEKEKTKLIIKNGQTVNVEIRFRFVNQTGNLLLILFDVDKLSNNQYENEWEIFTKAQSSGLKQIIDIPFLDLIQKIIDVGKLVSYSDEVVFYCFQQGNTFLKRMPSESENFPEQIPAFELNRIKEVDLWEPGKRVLSEIHRVGRLKKFNSIITVPVTCHDQQFGLIIFANKNLGKKISNRNLISVLSSWAGSTIELYEEINQRGNDHHKLIEKVDKLERFYNNTDDFLLLLDNTNKIIEFNSNFLNFFEYLPFELLNKNIEEIFENSPLLSKLNESSSFSDTDNSKILEVFNRHGIRKSVSYKIISFGNGETERKLIILNDKTDVVEMENTLSNLQKSAALGEILAEFSHDVRNIINRITTGLQLLIKKINPDESALSSLQEIQDECGEMTDLMESVLSFSRQDYEKYRSENIKEMVDRIFYKNQKRANQANISLILNLLGEDHSAWCDQRSLERVINNLINNGIDAIGESGGAVSVNISDSEENPGFLLLQIADTGPGIPPEIQARLYQKFVSGKSQGTGLGLFISQKIIEYHNGWIKLDTFPGGTIFNIYLPKEKRGHTP